MSRGNHTAVMTLRGLGGREDRATQSSQIRCQICSARTIPGLDLGQQPVSDLLVSKAELNRPETYYPLKLQHCMECGLTQLSYIVNPKVVYKHFPFVSGTTQTATKHLQSLPKRLVDMLGLNKNSFAVDVGSNDGTLLKGYLPHGVKFLGVDPAGDPVRIANQEGLTTLHAFFNADTANHILSHYGPAHAITACGVFGHMADLSGVMKGVKTLLASKGVFATDSQYWLDMVERLHYDNIFHQHLRYYSMKPLIHLHRQYDMDIFDVERSDVYGGSIRVFACHAGDYPVSQRVQELLALEEEQKLYEVSTYQRFARGVEDRRSKLFDSVYRLTAKGKKVVGIGAPAKATVVCNYCRLGPEFIEYLTEVNPLRIGHYLPGMHILIRDENDMFDDERPADAGILFAWNYYDEVVPKLRKRGFNGDILLP
jgi:C-methyltransferase C-terminal domain/Putative zinc binding domain/Methyltransferase domain